MAKIYDTDPPITAEIERLKEKLISFVGANSAEDISAMLNVLREENDSLRKERDELKEYERYANEYKDWIALKHRIKELEERNQILYEEMV